MTAVQGQPFTPWYFAIGDSQTGLLDLSLTAGLLPDSDLALATAMIQMCAAAGCAITYSVQAKCWRRWDGSVHEAQKVSFGSSMADWAARAVQTVLSAALDQIADEADRRAVLAANEVSPDRAGAGADRVREAEGKNLRKPWAKVIRYAERIWNNAGHAGLIRQLELASAADENDFDRHPGIIVLDDGYLDIREVTVSGRVVLYRNDPSMLLTKRMARGVRWDPGAACPVFWHFLETSVPDDSQRWWLLWRTVMAMAGLQPRKGYVNTIGESNSGKTTFQAAMKALGGGYVKSVPIETFLRSSSDSGFKQAALRSTRMVITAEPAPGKRFDEGVMKLITGRDPVTTSAKYEKEVEWLPQLTIFFGSNDPIGFNTADEASFGRSEPVRFTAGYERMDENLLEKLSGEHSGMLALLVRHALDQHKYRHHGVPDISLSMRALREDIADEMDSPLEFTTEMINEGRLAERPDAFMSACVQTGVLYREYRQWCEQAGVRMPLGRKAFSQVVGRRYPVTKSSGRHFSGLVLSVPTQLIHPS